MSALPLGHKRRSPFEVISQWWRVWTRYDPMLSNPACCAEGEVERIAKDIGIPAAEVRRLASLGPESADLLLSRMAALNLDRKEVARMEPQAFRDLQRVCAMCESHRQCGRDLARDSNDPAWKDYCPNIVTLKLLNAMPWTRASGNTPR
jgi:hypothetical protein